jgi:hypothetical protein
VVLLEALLEVCSSRNTVVLLEALLEVCSNRAVLGAVAFCLFLAVDAWHRGGPCSNPIYSIFQLISAY